MRENLLERLGGLQDAEVNWYGLQPQWQIALEASGRREHGSALQLEMQLHRVTYRIPVKVPGRRRPVNVGIIFYRQPPYKTYGLAAEEYPRVHVDTAGCSPHRIPGDNALCLYYPSSAEMRRWTPGKGLLALIDLTRDHLFFEEYWRATGGRDGGTWLGDEQPHGLQDGKSQ